MRQGDGHHVQAGVHWSGYKFSILQEFAIYARAKSPFDPWETPLSHVYMYVRLKDRHCEGWEPPSAAVPYRYLRAGSIGQVQLQRDQVKL